MNRKKLESAVRMGLELASGKPIDQAVKAVISCLELVLDMDIEPSPKKPSQSARPPVSPDVNPEPLRDLAPIGPTEGATKPSKTRIYWQQEEISQQLSEATPLTIEVTPDGHQQPLVLQRSISYLAGDIAGIQLAYRPAGTGLDTPFPKRTYWCSDEEIVINGVVEKLTKDAVAMYKLRSTPVVPRPVPEVPLRFNIGGEVS